MELCYPRPVTAVLRCIIACLRAGPRRLSFAPFLRTLAWLADRIYVSAVSVCGPGIKTGYRKNYERPTSCAHDTVLVRGAPVDLSITWRRAGNEPHIQRRQLKSQRAGHRDRDSPDGSPQEFVRKWREAELKQRSAAEDRFRRLRHVTPLACEGDTRRAPRAPGHLSPRSTLGRPSVPRPDSICDPSPQPTGAQDRARSSGPLIGSRQCRWTSLSSRVPSRRGAPPDQWVRSTSGK